MQRVVEWLKEKHIISSGQPVQCLGCGQCCKSFGGHLRASKSDILRWRQLERDDLLCRINRLGWIWIDPETGKMEDPCPFIEPIDEETAHCAIHAIKPDMCRDYPTLAHGRRCLRGVFMKAITSWISFESLAWLSAEITLFA